MIDEIVEALEASGLRVDSITDGSCEVIISTGKRVLVEVSDG